MDNPSPSIAHDEGPSPEEPVPARKRPPFLVFGVDVWALFFVEFTERIAYYGSAFMLTSYTVEMLGMTAEQANYCVNGLYALSPVSSVFASGLSDGPWGRKQTLLVFGGVYFLGISLIAVSACPFMFHDFPNDPTKEAYLCLILGLLVFSVGFGGMKVCISPLEADTLSAQQAHIPLGKLFRWAYWVINVGSLFGLIGAPLLRQLDGRTTDTVDSSSGSGQAQPHAAGFYLGFLMCAGSMLLGLLLFAWRFHRYPVNRRKASYVMFRIFGRAVAVWVQFRLGLLGGGAAADADADDAAAGSGGFERQCVERRHGGHGFFMYAAYVDWQTQPCLGRAAVDSTRMNAPRNYDRLENPETAVTASPPGTDDRGVAAPITPTDDHDPAWNIYSVRNVAELADTCRACTVFLPLPFYWLIANQFSTNVILQAAGTDLPTYFPADAFNNINTFTVVIGVALLDTLVFPWLGGPPTVKRRMLIGFLFAGLAMVYCAVLEMFLDRRGVFTAAGSYDLHPGETERLSAWWLVPPFVVQGLAAIFVDTAAMEAAYTVAAKQFKSSVASLYLLASSASGFLGLAFAPFAVPNQMVAVFFALAAMQAVVAGLFGALHTDAAPQEADLVGSPLLTADS